MRYLYGHSDEKFVKDKGKSVTKENIPLSSYKFRLNSLIKGKAEENEFDKNDLPLVFKSTPDKLLNLCAKVVDAIPLPMVYTWTIEDICKWLRGYGYRQYQNTFRENHINGHTLLLMDASALSAMNIRNFDHIKQITYGIRSLFYFEMTKFGRSLTLYPDFHYELYKLFRIKTGAKYEKVRRTDLWRNMQLIREKEPNYSHWEILERWLTFTKEPENKELYGGIRRSQLYRCKAKPLAAATAQKVPPHSCQCLPPCECFWTVSDLRPPWRLKCLPYKSNDNEFVRDCKGCMPPCTCRWSPKKFQTRSVLKCLQLALPQKYAACPAQCRVRHGKYDERQSYRLSMM